jgi:putative endonuclease
MASYWIYILHCDNNAFYTGYTTDMERRYQEHIAGKCKYTRSFKPLGIAQCWQMSGDKASAMRIERYIKKLSRKQKEHLLQHPENLADLFAAIKIFTPAPLHATKNFLPQLKRDKK